MIRGGLASLALWSAVACGRSQGIADQELGNLVVETRPVERPIEVARAAKDPAELGRSLMQPHRRIVEALGPHTATLIGVTSVEEGGKPTTELGERTTLELGDGGAYHGVYTNTQDYGREVTFVGGTLYLRPRYQRWHGRAPESADEPAALRDQLFASIAATWELVAPAAELTDLGAAQVAGRAGRKLEIKLSPEPATNPAEPLAQRRWREQRVVEALTGEVILDAHTAAPLAVKLAATIAFSRDGRRMRMKTSLTATVTGIGEPAAITAPPASEVVATPERLREVDDRDFLLQNIAPPLRKNADGTAATPQPAPTPTPTPTPPAAPPGKGSGA